MSTLDDTDLEAVTAGKLPRGPATEALEAYKRLAESLGRNGNQIGGAAGKIGDLADDIRRRLGPQ